MFNDYEKPLHGPIKWKTMESPGCELDEEGTDAAIADLMRSEVRAQIPSPVTQTRPEFPPLAPCDGPEPVSNLSVLDAVKRKWAAFAA